MGTVEGWVVGCVVGIVLGIVVDVVLTLGCVVVSELRVTKSCTASEKSMQAAAAKATIITVKVFEPDLFAEYCIFFAKSIPPKKQSISLNLMLKRNYYTENNALIRINEKLTRIKNKQTIIYPF